MVQRDASVTLQHTAGARWIIAWQAGTIWVNLSQMMKLVGKTKKQCIEAYGDAAFDERCARVNVRVFAK